jgi:hypothetical protein
MSPWLLFEAGALSKLQTEKDAHVCTYLIDMPHTAVTGPLAEFQHTLATKDDTRRLLQTINAAIPEEQGRLTEAQLDRAFKRCWPELEQCLNKLPKPREPSVPPRASDDILREILEIVRSLAKPPPSWASLPATGVSPETLGQLLGRPTEGYPTGIADYGHSGMPVIGGGLGLLRRTPGGQFRADYPTSPPSPTPAPETPITAESVTSPKGRGRRRRK